MNLFSFVRLLGTIFRDREPDLRLIQSQGLLAVKIAQLFALRPDFLGEDRCRALARLYSNTDVLPPEDAIALLKRYAGQDFLSHFSAFEVEPFASASIGQVHRAALRTGERVVVKLVKDRFAEQFRRDVVSVRRLFRWAIFLYPKLHGVADPVSLLREMEQTTLRELDLRNEVSGWSELHSIYQANRGRFDLSRLRFRKVYEELSNEHVLVSEFAEGPTLDELLDRGALSYEDLLELFHLHGFFMFSVGTFHGDLHPGNLVLKDGTYTFLDTGSIGRVHEKMRTNLLCFFDALSQGDYSQAAVCLNRMADCGIEGKAYAAFERKFVALYAGFKEKTVSQESLTKKMMQTIRLGVLSGMRFDEGMFDIIKSLMYLDGMVIRANPNAVLLRDMRRFIDDLNAVMAKERSGR